MKPQHILPVALFLALAATLFLGLFLDPSETPFGLEDKPVPAFDLPPVPEDGDGLATGDLTDGEVSLVNFWATWCAPCRAEHPLLMELSGIDGVVIHGIDYKDRLKSARFYLEGNGNPYARTGFDEAGRTGIDWGISGVPETFAVDRNGRVVWRWQGPLNAAVIRNELLPLIEDLKSKEPTK